MRQGEMTEAEAAVHPQRHILTRALGIGPDVETDMWDLQLQTGDRIVLCSDGLSNEVSLTEMASVLAGEPEPTGAAQALVDRANARGGSDNITVVVVDVLVGEEADATASVVTPVGALAGAALVLEEDDAGASPTAAVPGVADTAAVAIVNKPPPGSDDTMAVQMGDTLERGSRLGFSGTDTTLGAAAGAADFLSEPSPSGTVPLARSSMRVPPRPTLSRSAPPGRESWGARRRRLGVPRRITVRVLLFVVLVAAIPVAAFFTIRWYAYDNWYLALSGKQVVIKQGHPAGVLWFKSKTVDHTGITTAQVLPPGLAQIKSGVQEPSLSDAKRYVDNLHDQYVFLHSVAKASTGANSLGPSGSIPNITAPPPACSTTTTAAGQTAATPTTSCVPPSTVPGEITVPPPTTTTTTAPPVTTTTVALP
jgi:hypothetical protein